MAYVTNVDRKHSSNCCVATCVNTSVNRQDLVFFSLPTNKDRRDEWLRLIWREDLVDLIDLRYRYYSVCQDHFAEECILKTGQRKILRSYAVPSLCLPQLKTKRETDIPQVSAYTQTYDINDDDEVQILMTPTVKKNPGLNSTQTIDSTHTDIVDENVQPGTSRKRNLEPPLAESKVIKKTIATHTDMIDENVQPGTSWNTNIETPLTESKVIKKYSYMDKHKTRRLFEQFCKELLTKNCTQLILIEKRIADFARDNRLHESFRLCCLNIYHASPQNYSLLQGVLGLPDIFTLYKKMTITMERNDCLLSTLQLKVENMTDKDKDCLLVIDSMNLVPNLRYDVVDEKIVGFHEINGIQSPALAVKALVFMIRGIFSDWKQPIGYALLSEECTNDVNLAKYVNELLHNLCNIGLNVRMINFASEEGAEFFEKRWVSVDAPYFYINNKQKVYFITDPTLLLKLLRNCFMLHDFYFKGRIAKYKHIVDFYNKDIKNKFRLAPKLTSSHICPTSSEKLNNSYALELLSNTVAAGLSAYINYKEIEEGRATVELITKMNDLFDCLNSAIDDNKKSRKFNGDTSQLMFLKAMLVFFQNLTLLDCNGQDVTLSENVIQSFQITIKSILYLFDDLKMATIPVPPITLNRIDTKEFFNQIKTISKKSNATGPTIQHFIKAFEKSYILNILRPLKERSKTCNHEQFIYLVNMTFNTRHDLLLEQNSNREKSSISGHVEPNANRKDIPISISDCNHIDSSERHSLIYISGYLLKKCIDNHKNCVILKNFVKGIGCRAIKSFTRYIDYSQRNKISLKVAPCDEFVRIIENLEKVFLKYFKRYHTNYRIEQLLYIELGNIILDLPCLCFPKTYMIKLFIRLRIAYTIQLNNKNMCRNLKHFIIPLLLSN